MNAPLPTFLIPETPYRRSAVFLSEDNKVATAPQVVAGLNTASYESSDNLREGMPIVDSYLARCQIPPKRYKPPVVLDNSRRAESADASVIQTWEGKVLRVDPQQEVMEVSLEAMIGDVPAHAAEIELQWVSDQDRDLVKPGAIFYLTLFKRTRHGSIDNTQELRFRRLPAWTRQQVARVHEDALRLQAKMKARPLAE